MFVLVIPRSSRSSRNATFASFAFSGGDQSTYLNRSNGCRCCPSVREKVLAMAGLAAQANVRWGLVSSVTSQSWWRDLLCPFLLLHGSRSLEDFRILQRVGRFLLNSLHETVTPSFYYSDVDVRARGESLLCKRGVPSYVCALAKRIILHWESL